MLNNITYSFLISGALILMLFCGTEGIKAQNNCGYSWTNQSPGTLNNYNSVKAVSSLVCWAAGSGSTVRRTTDGGSTWLNGNPNTGVINGEILFIEALDENNAWVTTTPPSSNTFIFKTTNGGNNWIQVYSNSGGNINGIKMIDAMNGYAFGHPVSGIWNILVTSNGGLNWSSLPTAPAAELGEQGFRNAVYVLPPYMWFGASFGSVYRSTDNGTSWSSNPTTGLNSYIFAVHFNNYTLGLASGASMVRSTNSGINYSLVSAPGMGNINGIEGRDNEFWITRQTQIYRSTDAGSTWTSVLSTSYTMMDIDFPDNQTGCLTGWAVGYGGTIVKITGMLTETEKISGNIPEHYQLGQNYPNPFNPVTRINYRMPVESLVQISVFDLSGKVVCSLVNEVKRAGDYSIDFDGSSLSSGIYFYRLKTSTYDETRKMILVK